MDDIEIDTNKLISLVESRPALYDKTLKCYSNRQIKEKLWLEICEILITGWTELTNLEKAEVGAKVQNRWQNVRTCFKKEYNAQRDAKSGKGINKRKKYMYFDQLSFLLPTLTDRFDINDVSHKHMQKPTKSLKVELVDTSSSHDFGQTSALRAKTITKPEKTYEGRLLEVVEMKSKDEMDEDTHFMLSLVPSLRRLTSSQKIKVKMKFLQVIADMEDDDDA